MPGGSVEHWDEEPGGVWIERMTEIYKSAVWLNPVAEHLWSYTPSIELMSQLMGGRMFPLTLEGIDTADAI